MRTSLAPVLRMRCGPGPPRVELAAAEASEAAVPGEDRDRGHGLDRDGVVEGEDGLRVALNLTLRHLAPSMSRGQPQGSAGPVRSTRSKTTTLDVTGQSDSWTPDEEDALPDGMRRDGKDLATIRKEYHYLQVGR